MLCNNNNNNAITFFIFPTILYNWLSLVCDIYSIQLEL